MFKTTATKDFIRDKIDKKHIISFFNKKGKKLKYIGLPGEELHDMVCWKDYLGDIYAVEFGDYHHPDVMQNIMYFKAVELGLMDRFFIFEGELDDILISGKDDYGNKLNYPYDLVNFDYCGSVLYSGFRRIESIKAFIGNQAPNDFLLLHSSRIKKPDEPEILRSIETIKTELLTFYSQKEIKNDIEQYFQQLINGKEILFKFLREKLFNLYFIKLYAESKGYLIEFNDPIIYKGFKDHILMRFTTFFTYSGKITTKVVSSQSILDIINMPILHLSDPAKGMIKLENPLGKLIL